MRDRIEQAVWDWLDDNFADLQPWEEEGVIEQDMWDDLWRRLEPIIMSLERKTIDD